MSLYTLADLHLPFGVNKPMDIFGGEWEGYVEKLTAGLSCLTSEDTLVIPGDLSWAINLEDALPDFNFINALPGKKLLVKGNHDLWWTTVTKMRRFFAEHELDTLDILHNSCSFYGDAAICGTRGWFYEEETGGEHDARIMKREIGRLEASLKAAKAADARRIYCFMHYPPIFGYYECPEIVTLLAEYGVSDCFYGHLHSTSRRKAYEGDYGGVNYHLVSADHINFTPLKVI